MNALIKAVKDRATTTVSGTATGGVHIGSAPTGTVMPYVVLRPLPSFGLEENTSEEMTEFRGMRCAAFSYSAATSSTLLGLIEAAFVGQTLTLSTGHVLHGTKGGDDLQEEPERDDTGQEVWQGIIDLEFLVQRKPGE